MRLSDLRDLRVKTSEGQTLGRVHEVHCENGLITALICGSGSFIERLTAKSGGRRIRWECVRSIDAKKVVVTTDPPARKAKPKPKASVARTRQGTRRTSERPSKR